MVEVARSTSMITTIALLISYKSSNAGDGDVCSVGLLFDIFQISRKNKVLEYMLPLTAFSIFFDHAVALFEQFFNIIGEV
jgi:hypothetical protein